MDVGDIGQGLWPAFWLLGADFPSVGWPSCGEIDIMEYRGQEPRVLVGTIHGPGYAGDYSVGSRHVLSQGGFHLGFHTFAIDWDYDGIRWYFDGELYSDRGRDSLGEREWVFDQPFFIILNLALGGTVGGLIAPDTEFPQYMYVDYVRVYQSVDG